MRRRPLTVQEILGWADAYREARGRWPTGNAGAIAGARFESWQAVDAALRQGQRGLPAGSSLARLLAERRGVRNRKQLPLLTEELITAWADAHRERTGQWPRKDSGAIAECPGERWQTIDNALLVGLRGLPGASSLARLLAERRGVRNRKALPPLTEKQILAWADAHRSRTAKWPSHSSGAILDAPGETWGAADNALRAGLRGLPGGASLARLLSRERSVRNGSDLPDLSLAQVLEWADAHRARTGKWPTVLAGPVYEAPQESWGAIHCALRTGTRGLPIGASLAKLLMRERAHGRPGTCPS